MRYLIIGLSAAVLGSLLLPAPSPAGDGFVMVVNQKNPVDKLARAQVSDMFLKRVRTWPNGARVVPCDLSGASTVRAAFSQGVHRKPAWFVVAYWQQEIASGRSQPPTVYAEERAALGAVRDDPGGIAYVSEDAPLGPGVKRLALEP
jgi:ABC-type phosphate transport system substrate-binding protein